MDEKKKSLHPVWFFILLCLGTVIFSFIFSLLNLHGTVYNVSSSLKMSTSLVTVNNLLSSKGIRYIWASEYGESEGSTHRPHYHWLFFFPNECISQEVLGFDPDDELSWKEFLASYWTSILTEK